jgi:hypothetical protein
VDTFTFYIHFSRTQSKLSKILQWYEGVPISHVLVEFETPHLGQNFVYHSVIGGGVSFLSRAKFDKTNEIMETYKISLEQGEYRIMRNQLLTHCGEQYAMMQNLGVVLVDLIRKFKDIQENPFKEGQNCSELIYRYVIPYVCADSGEYTPDLVKPSQIRGLLKNNNINPIISMIETEKKGK